MCVGLISQCVRAYALSAGRFTRRKKASDASGLPLPGIRTLPCPSTRRPFYRIGVKLNRICSGYISCTHIQKP